MSKFFKGDVVKITVTERGEGWNHSGLMDKYIGATVQVYDVLDDDEFLVYDPERTVSLKTWIFRDCEAELVHDVLDDVLHDPSEVNECLNTLFR